MERELFNFFFFRQDSNGQKYSVILLDSEGIESVMGEAKDDNQIFTLTVLLASVLIYNSASLAKRRDVEELEYPCLTINLK